MARNNSNPVSRKRQLRLTSNGADKTTKTPGYAQVLVIAGNLQWDSSWLHSCMTATISIPSQLPMILMTYTELSMSMSQNRHAQSVRSTGCMPERAVIRMEAQIKQVQLRTSSFKTARALCALWTFLKTDYIQGQRDHIHTPVVC